MKSRFLMKIFPCYIVLLLAFGCADRHPIWYEGIYDLSNVPLSKDLSPSVAACLASLEESVPTGKGVDDFRKFGQLPARIIAPESRVQASDELFALWKADPENILWAELALKYSRFLQRDNDIDQMYDSSSVGDTNSTAGMYFEGWIQYYQTGGARMYNKAETQIAGLDSIGQVWLNVKLATADHQAGHTIDSVRRLLKWLPVAHRVGGPSCESRLWLIIANRLALIDRQNDALYAATLSAVLARHANNHFAELSAEFAISKIMGRQQEFEPAIARMETVVAKAERHQYYWLMQKGLDGAAEIAVVQGDYNRALSLDRRQLSVTFAIGDSLNAPRNLVSIAHNFRMAGQLDSCFTYLTRAENIVKKSSGQLNLPEMTEHLAEYNCLVGNYAVAESLIVEARGLSTTTSAVIHEARLLVKLLPQALEMGRIELAYGWLGRMEELENRLFNHSMDQNLRADYKLLSTSLLSRQGEFQLAAAALGQARAEIQIGGGEGLEWKYSSIQGDLALLRNDFLTAEKAFSRCLELAHKSPDQEKVAGSRLRLGHLYLETGRLAQARVLFEANEAGGAFGPRYRTRLIRQLLLGITYGKEGRHKEALEILQSGLDKFTPSSPPDLVLRYSLAKGQALIALGRDQEAETILRGVLESASGASQAIAFDELKIYRSGVGREAAEALIGLYFDQPSLLPTRNLGRETLLITGLFGERIPEPEKGAPWFIYRVGIERSWVWVIDENGPMIHSLPGLSELRQILKPVLADMVLAGRPVNGTKAFRLAEILLGPGLSSWHPNQSLTIVPDGLLHGLPWSALPISSGGELVIDRGPVLEYSGAYFQNTQHSDPNELSLMAIGCNSQQPSSQLAKTDLPRLRKAEQEAQTIHDNWPNPYRQLLVGEDACWDDILADGLRNSGVIHLASHAQVHQGLPQRSTLRLSAGKRAAPVTIGAISRLNLDAELVYLSCCNAAQRLSPHGSGVSDFAGAFLEAGARAVIASTHWVEDEASAFMAKQFYGHWLEGMSKAEALRAAQQDLRAARKSWDHPSYWGFFRLIENGG